jgi:hypothetical protein
MNAAHTAEVGFFSGGPVAASARASAGSTSRSFGTGSGV